MKNSKELLIQFAEEFLAIQTLAGGFGIGKRTELEVTAALLAEIRRLRLVIEMAGNENMAFCSKEQAERLTLLAITMDGDEEYLGYKMELIKEFCLEALS